MRNTDEIIQEIRKAQRMFDELPNPVKKIKMKEEYYNNLAREVQSQYQLTEILNKDGQPLNRMCDIRIEIDNSIENDYEVVV